MVAGCCCVKVQGLSSLSVVWSCYFQTHLYSLQLLLQGICDCLSVYLPAVNALWALKHEHQFNVSRGEEVRQTEVAGQRLHDGTL